MRRFDVVVIGFGGAGACAAIEAAEAGASVLALDRAHGGGATALSGGVVYAGGGTPFQIQAGYQDTPEAMFAYLQHEVRDAVDEKTLRRFCDESAAMLTWLEAQGVPFRGGVPPYKTSYPTDAHYLYHSGNELAHPYAGYAPPAPRGHRTYASGLDSGATFYRHLKQSALAKGVVFEPLARAHELVVTDGRVSGVRYRVVRSSQDNRRHAAAQRRHARVTRRGGKLGNWFPQLGRYFNAHAERIWQAKAVPDEVAAGAVVLAAGGFVHNRPWFETWAGPYRDINPLGTAGDDGSGIAMGQAVGGDTRFMDRFTAWRFLTPPSGFIEGVSVGLDGRRIANEDLYGATFTDVMVRDFDGVGRVVLDSRQWRHARGQVAEQANLFQGFQARYLFRLGHHKADTLEDLARRIGVDPAGLAATVAAYNAGIAGPDGDPARKSPSMCSPVVEPPFYAIDISVRNVPAYPVSGLTLGGLRVNEDSGAVLDRDGQDITSLFAAGRTAVGLCSDGYLSGMSLADCVFSGRRAGVGAAAAARSSAAGSAADRSPADRPTSA